MGAAAGGAGNFQWDLRCQLITALSKPVRTTKNSNIHRTVSPGLDLQHEVESLVWGPSLFGPWTVLSKALDHRKRALSELFWGDWGPTQFTASGGVWDAPHLQLSGLSHQRAASWKALQQNTRLTDQDPCPQDSFVH